LTTAKHSPEDSNLAIRALEAFAAYDSLRLITYRNCESLHERIRIEQAYGAYLLRFDDVGYFNRVYASSGSVGEHLDQVEDFYRDSPYGCELVADCGEQEFLARACSLRGWRQSSKYAWLHMDLNAPEVAGEYPEISIREPLPEEQTAFLEFYLRGFEAPVANFPAAIRNMRHLFNLPQLHFLIASRKGIDAAIGMLCVFGEVALLSAGATLPEQRRHGCHHAALISRIRLARKLGCTDIYSYAYAGGQSHINMESMGLRTVRVTQSWRFKGTVRS